MDKREYFFKIAETVYPELKAGRFFAFVNATEYYFSGLIKTEIKNIYKSFYDEFDFAFSVQCTFSLCDMKTKTRWVRQEGSEHFYSTPPLFVVERTEFDYAPEQLVKRMHAHYRANTLVLRSYIAATSTLKQLTNYMNRSGINLILKKELELENIAPVNDFSFRKQVNRNKGMLLYG